MQKLFGKEEIEQYSQISLENMVLPNQFHTEYHRVTLSHTKTPIPWGFLVVESPKTA